MAVHPTPDQRAAQLASRQHGAISHHQALAAGLSARQVGLRVDAGRWGRVARAVYVLTGSPDTAQRRAWVASLATSGAGGVLSYLTAVWLHGLGSPPLLPHVTVPAGRSTRSGVAVVHRGEVPPVDRATVNGLRCTSASRAIVDAASVLDGWSLRELLDDALCRGLASPRSVNDAADRVGGGRRGLTLVRTELEVWTEDIQPDSVAEVRLLRSLAELGAVGFVTQHEVRDETGAFVARLDVAAPARRQAFEYDGRRRHNPRHWGRDEPRYERLRALGWDVAPVTKVDLLPGETYLADVLRRWGVVRAA